jgi:hypothetical protein
LLLGGKMFGAQRAFWPLGAVFREGVKHPLGSAYVLVPGR